jgi:hypothetical protein
LTDDQGPRHPTPLDDGADLKEEWLGPRLQPGVGEQPPFATQRLSQPPPDLAALWKRRLTRAAAFALALLILYGVWKWFNAAKEQLEPCKNSGFPSGCDEPPAFWRQGQFVLVLVGIPFGVVTAALAGYGAIVGRRVRGLRALALGYLGLLVVWIAMHWLGRWIW